MNRNYCINETATLLATVLIFMLSSSGISGTEIVNGVQHPPGKTITLAKGGVTEYVILESENPIPAERTAASDLARFLKKVTGAEFKIVKEKPDKKLLKGIYIGWTAFAASQGISLSKFASEEWFVTTAGDSLIITGGRPRGTLNGVYEFLEEIVGVHELDPITEIIPATPDLTVNAPKLSGKPAFLFHQIYSPYKHFAPEKPDFAFYFFQFNKNDMGRCLEYGIAPKYGSPGNGHTFGRYIHPNDYGISHPEYFSMNEKGQRVIDSKGTTSEFFDLCLSNSEVRKIITGKLRGFIEADRKAAKELNLPAPFIYDISQNDCVSHGCLCPNCKAIIDKEGGAESGVMIDFINEIADNIKKDYPDILLQTFAYNYTLKTPKISRPRDNVIIRWCDNYSMSEFFRPLSHEYNKGMRDLFESWSHISKNMAVWDYWRIIRPHAPGFYAPFANILCLKTDLEYFLKNGVKSIFIENEDFQYTDDTLSDDLQSFLPLRTWLGFKLMQDPGKNEEKLLDIFFNGYYGPAAGKMRKFLAYIERRQNASKQKLILLDRDDYYKAYLDLEFFITARKLLDEAVNACGSDAFHKVRVLRERIPVDSALLHLEPSLRKKFCSAGEPFPFNRAQVLSEYTAAWDAYMNTFMSEKAREKAKPFVNKRLEYLRTMPMSTLDSIRYNTLPVADSAIRIDGIIDEAAWKKAPRIFLTSYEKMQPLKAKTTVRALWSKNKLHLAFECSEDNIKDMKFQQRRQDDPNAWKDSSVEIFINPSGDRSTYYQLIVTPAGVLSDRAGWTIEGKKDFDTSWNSGSETAVKINNDSWIVEMAIPFKGMNFDPKEGIPLVCNFCRTRYLNSDAQAMQLQTWSPFLSSGYQDIEKFGKIILTGESNEVLFTSFEGAQDTPSFLPMAGCVAAFRKEQASEGDTSLRLEFKKSDDFVGITFKAGERSDWSEFAIFKADIFVKGPPMNALVRLAAADKAFYSGIALKSGWNKGVTLTNLVKAGEKVDLSKIENFMLYVPKGQATSDHILFLDNLRLVCK